MYYYGIERKCAFCGSAIGPDSSPNRRYCSDRCRRLRWERDNPEKLRAAIWSWNVRHPAHRAEVARDWYQRNRKLALETSREWSKANRHRRTLYQRARQQKLDKSGWTREDFTKARDLLDGACAYCGSTENLTLDHVVPLSRGGSHSIENLVAACKPCNSRKGARDELEYRALLALEALIEGRRRRFGERRTGYRVRRPCRDARQDHVASSDTDVGSCDVRWAQAA